MKTYNDPIPKEKFNQWYELFCNVSGRFILEPVECNNVIRVSYTFNDINDYTVLHEGYRRLTTNITETKSSWFKRLGKRLG